MLKLIRFVVRRERAQILPIMALLLVAFMGLLGLAIDGGRLFVAKTELSRALDSAALAGVVELPDDDEAQSKATAYMLDHLPEAQLEFPVSTQDFQFRVTGSRTLDMTFMGIFGFGEVNITGTAAAGFGEIAVDVVLAIDSTGSMGASPCNDSQSNNGCPIKEAKDAAIHFAELLLGLNSTDTQVGVVPYNDCYAPPFSGFSAWRCIDANLILELTSNESAATSAIDAIQASGWTNVCFGLLKAGDILFGTNSSNQENALHIIVILSDGDNNYNQDSYSSSLSQPPSACRPSNPGTSDPNVNDAGCNPSQANERDLDEQMWDVAESLKAQGAEIYVIGFGVCGTPNSAKPSDSGYCNGVGNADHDNAADRRLLKCITSSSSGTNDHYFEVPTAEDLPDVFEQIIQAIAFRLIE